MFLIIGLGNPGKEYAQTRHTIGFGVIDAFSQKNKFPDFRLDKKSNSLVTIKSFNDTKVILAKPQIFMNNSGEAIKKLLQEYGNHNLPKADHISRGLPLQPAPLIIIHDDIDIALGKVKIARNRGSAGHKGVESIIQELKTKDFVRLRVGIQPARGKPRNVDRFVLHEFSLKEDKFLRGAIEQSCDALETLVLEGIDKAQNKLHQTTFD